MKTGFHGPAVERIAGSCYNTLEFLKDMGGSADDQLDKEADYQLTCTIRLIIFPVMTF